MLNTGSSISLFFWRLSYLPLYRRLWLLCIIITWAGGRRCAERTRRACRRSGPTAGRRHAAGRASHARRTAMAGTHRRRLSTSPEHDGRLGSRVVSVLLDSGAEGPGIKSQPRRCRVTVLGKLFTPIVPLFTKQRNWQQPSS